MRVVLQRVSRASVTVDGAAVGAIGRGLLVLVGVANGDSLDTVARVAKKCAEMRIFPDEAGRFDRSAIDISGEALVVSQFTLLADVRKGRRPSFLDAAPPEIAEPLVTVFADALRALGLTIAQGRFGASMQVELVNDGPVTVIVDSAELPA